MGALFMLSLNNKLGQQYPLEDTCLQRSGGPVFTYVALFLFFIFFLVATQGMLFDCLTLVARRACITGPYGTVTFRKTVLSRKHAKGTAQRAD